MRTAFPAQPRTAQDLVAQAPKATKTSPCRLLLLLTLILTAGTLFAAGQQPGAEAQATGTSAHRPVRPHKHPSAVHPAAPSALATSAPIAPVAPKPPDWPANDRPNEATVHWNSQGLRIEASNSSLEQILHDVATATGARVEGLVTDERVFGSYGPGKARDVLSQLLDGCGYNVLMIGDQGQGTPREVVLSAQPKGDAPPVANTQTAANDENADSEDQPQPQPQAPPAIRNGFAPSAPPRTPQQIMQEMQQRQLQQMEQNQQRNNPQQ
jgi:hypothetical protein